MLLRPILHCWSCQCVRCQTGVHLEMCFAIYYLSPRCCALLWFSRGFIFGICFVSHYYVLHFSFAHHYFLTVSFFASVCIWSRSHMYFWFHSRISLFFINDTPQLIKIIELSCFIIFLPFFSILVKEYYHKLKHNIKYFKPSQFNLKFID